MSPTSTTEMSPRQFSRRSILAAMGAAAIPPLLLGGCESRSPRSVFLLKDLSASPRPEDRASEHVTEANLVAWLNAAQAESAADQLTVAAISGAALPAFRPLLTSTITYVGTPDREDQIASKRKALVAAIAALEPQARSRETRCFDALAGAAELMAAATDAGRTPTLIIESDMLEDSPLVRFATNVPTEQTTRRLLHELKVQSMLPDFRGARVRVTGGGGKDGAAYEAVKKFWATYFEKGNANGTLVTYIRAPLEFAPGAE